jgi:hypothetical protein
MYRTRQQDLPFQGSSHRFVGADHGEVGVSVFFEPEDAIHRLAALTAACKSETGEEDRLEGKRKGG